MYLALFSSLPGSNADIGHCSWCNYSIYQLLNNSIKKEIEVWSRCRRKSLKGATRDKTYPSKVGTPSCLPACLRAPWWPLGCRCCEAFSLSRLFSASRLSSVPRPAPKSKRSSKTPRANWPNPEGNGNKCGSAFWEGKSNYFSAHSFLTIIIRIQLFIRIIIRTIIIRKKTKTSVPIWLWGHVNILKVKNVVNWTRFLKTGGFIQ